MKPKRKILIVEDERIVAEDISQCLQRAGYAVCGISKRGVDAIALAKEHEPDLALLDIVLRGDRDGISVGSELREMGIPFIYLTAYSHEDVLKRAKETEPLGYLIKPFDEASLLSTVEISIHKSQLDDQMRESREWFFTTLRSIGDGVIATDVNGLVVFMNKAAEELTGWGADEASGEDLTTVVPIFNEKTREPVANPALEAMRLNRVVPLANGTVLVRRDGTEISIDDAGSPIASEGTEMIGSVLIFRDVTVQKAAERERESYQQKLEDTVAERTAALVRRLEFERVVSSLCVDLVQRRDAEVDAGIEEALGTLGTFLGIDRCCLVANPSEKDGVTKVTHGWTADAMLALPQLNCAADARWKKEMNENGSIMLGSLADMPEEAHELRDRLSGAGVEAFAAVELLSSGRAEGLLVFCSADPVEWNVDDMHIAQLFAQMVASVIQRRADTEDKLRILDELNHAKKLEAIGRLTGGIAHDFNNMLLPIIGYADMLIDGTDEEGEGDGHHLAEIRRAAERAAGLTRQLLAFSRKQILKKEPVHLHGLFDGMRGMLERVLGEDVRIAIDCADDLHPVEADAGQMEQVFMNLCVNARDAMFTGGQITVVGRNECDAQHPGQDKVVVSFRDSGRGIDEASLAHIFDPFYSTKGADGTGLGLSVVRGIVEQHGGEIDAKSRLGEGSEFIITLPALDAQRAGTGEGRADALGERPVVGTGEGERILVIEDEPSVMMFVEMALRQNGYDVTTAMSVREAREVFDVRGGSFDLILSDAVLPDGNGMDVVLEFLGKRPELAALLTSGYTDHRALVESARRSGVGFIQKPYAMNDLYAAVEGAFGRAEVGLPA